MPFIKVPYDLTDADVQTLNNYPFLKWEDGKYDGIKGGIKEHYCRQQKKKCSYCQIELEHKCHGDHIEHIVDKDQKPRWMFDPYNLTIACAECNTAKGTKMTLYNHSNNSLFSPRGSCYYKIFHPHYDDYDVHFEFEDTYFIKPRNNHKGLRTIEICKLFRSLYVDKRMRHAGLQLIDRRLVIANRLQGNITQEERDELSAYVDEILRYL